ncbi:MULTISPECIES: zinc-finger-containing protein [unclassified Caballeronia]|uniref:zinc-finger-containing protein n=1 Tax=unclassified Caballeronia TaxID=2646786 RepID=UPI00285A96AD|nr:MULTISPECIES: zinc-finger-containing protein [unclassified Caballeronia]MDR5776382.1 zinc-finger-containing protein [Caballeronia sp. LZ002]MDR5851836.1 zinc-finger-containing protein [Caballeronia sp. LZ003]
MRNGKPIKPLPHPDCDYCGNPAVLARAGDDAYPYRDDHGPLWLCRNCHAWIGVFPRSKRNVPLGRLADARLRELKARLHAALEPLVAAKVRRDGCNVFEARAKAMKWLAGEIGADVEKCSIHTLDADQCARAIAVVDEFQRARTATASSEPAWDDR